MNLARVLEEGIGNLILNKFYTSDDELCDKLLALLDLEDGDLDLIGDNKKGIKEFNFVFRLDDKKYNLYICCYILVDKTLVPYACVVSEKNDELEWAI